MIVLGINNNYKAGLASLNLKIFNLDIQFCKLRNTCHCNTLLY